MDPSDASYEGVRPGDENTTTTTSRMMMVEEQEIPLNDVMMDENYHLHQLQQQQQEQGKTEIFRSDSDPPTVLADLALCKTSELSSSDDGRSSEEEVEEGEQDGLEIQNNNDIHKVDDSTVVGGSNDTPEEQGDGQGGSKKKKKKKKRWGLCEKWTEFTELLHNIVVKFVVTLSLLAVRNPKRCVYSIIFLSLALVGVGLFTNFTIMVDEKILYAPFGSIPQEHKQWLAQESGFVDTTRPVVLILHNDGKNVMGVEEMSMVFQALDTVRNTSGYHELCHDGAYWDDHKDAFDCRVISATRQWYHDNALYQSQVQTKQDLVEALSSPEYPGGANKDLEYVLGNLEFENDNTTISYIPAYFVSILLSGKGEQTEEFEALVIENILALREEWNRAGSKLHIEFFAERSFADEFQRAIANDMYLVAVVAFIMSAFTCLVFFRRDRVQSRCLLGVGSIFTITMSMFSGFGILFISGVPFSSMTQLLVFIIYGVGLDDTFIIMGAYFRTDTSKSTEERIRETMIEVGPSITATTITTSSAFILGLLSTVPAIFWLCLYAFPTITIVYIYQITLFIGFLVLDERRIRAKRKDCCCTCCPSACSQSGMDGEYDDNEEQEKPSIINTTLAENREKHMADAVMAWYGQKLMIPAVKVIVVTGFVAFFALCTYQTTMLTQEFDVKELLPEGSYATAALIAMDDYQEKTFPVDITFRDVDQSDPAIQEQMLAFINDVAGIDAFGEGPPFCWVQDFLEWKESDDFDVEIAGFSFQDQVKFALSQPHVKEVYGDDIVIDELGNIKSSRCTILITNKYVDYVDTTIELLFDQRAVTDAQPINHGRDREAFFTYSELFLLWEFYSIAVDELISTTISSVIAVNVVAFVFIPHWSAVLIMIPMISIIFIDMMGVLQMAGLHINAVTYVCLVISIGLIVDFLMHVLLRYFECSHKSREERVKDTLETMGASILLGGLSTFLGVIPIAFSSSTILRTVFTCFCSMVVLGVSHGLILLPVVLSVVGPIPEVGQHLPIEALKEEKTSRCDSSNASTKDGSPVKQEQGIGSMSLGSGSLVVPSEEDGDFKVSEFLMTCAHEMANATYPRDTEEAEREKAELVDYYWTIYRSTSSPEAFLDQLKDEVDEIVKSVVKDTC